MQKDCNCKRLAAEHWFEFDISVRLTLLRQIMSSVCLCFIFNFTIAYIFVRIKIVKAIGQ